MKRILSLVFSALLFFGSLFVLTSIIALERGNLKDMVTVSHNAVNFGRGNSLM